MNYFKMMIVTLGFVISLLAGSATSMIANRLAFGDLQSPSNQELINYLNLSENTQHWLADMGFQVGMVWVALACIGFGFYWGRQTQGRPTPFKVTNAA